MTKTGLIPLQTTTELDNGRPTPTTQPSLATWQFVLIAVREDILKLYLFALVANHCLMVAEYSENNYLVVVRDYVSCWRSGFQPK